MFFTNIDLTPGEQEAFKAHAKGKGVRHVEIFIRERLRLQLDSIEGWGYRLQFLEIEMSREEQLAFIERYGARLESMMEKQRQELNQQQHRLEQQLKRIEFMHDCAKPVVEAMFSVDLNRGYTAKESGLSRVLLQITSYILDPVGAQSRLSFGSQDDFRFADDGSLLFFSATNRVWSDAPDETIVNSGMPLVPMSKIFGRESLEGATTAAVGAFANAALLKSAFRTLGSFDRSMMRVYVTASLFDKIASVAFIVNDYLVVKASKPRLTRGGIVTSFHPPHWDPESATNERGDWVHLQVASHKVDEVQFPVNVDEMLSGRRSFDFQRPTFNIHFGEYIPERIGRVVPILPDIGAVQSSF